MIPLVFVHGFMGGSAQWDGQVAALAGVPVIALDLPGYGKNAHLEACRDIVDFAHWALDELERQNVARFHLLGHSMGGFTALAAGSRDNNLSCIGAMSPANMGSIKLGIGTEDSNSLRIMHYADSLYMLKDYGSRAMLEELRTTSLDKLDTRAFGPGLAGKPVLLVVGDKDQVTPAATAMLPVAEQYSKIPGLKLEHHVISGDHSFSWSRLALTKLVRDWMLRDCR